MNRPDATLPSRPATVTFFKAYIFEMKKKMKKCKNYKRKCTLL